MVLLLLLVTTTAFAQPSGPDPPLPALAMSAAFTPDEYLEITFANPGPEAFLLYLGTILGRWAEPGFLRFELLDATGARHKVDHLSGTSGVIGGRLDPFVVVLASGARYVLRLGLGRLYIRPQYKRLAELREHSWKLVIRFDGREAMSPVPGGRSAPFNFGQDGPSMLPFWIGKRAITVANTR